MAITFKEVIHLAVLARLDSTEQEIKKAEVELGSILEYVERLQKIDARSMEPQSMPARDMGWRTDKEVRCDEQTRELILNNFPERTDNLLRVPPVFEKPK